MNQNSADDLWSFFPSLTPSCASAVIWILCFSFFIISQRGHTGLQYLTKHKDGSSSLFKSDRVACFTFHTAFPAKMYSYLISTLTQVETYDPVCSDMCYIYFGLTELCFWRHIYCQNGHWMAQSLTNTTIIHKIFCAVSLELKDRTF